MYKFGKYIFLFRIFKIDSAQFLDSIHTDTKFIKKKKKKVEEKNKISCITCKNNKKQI